MARQQDVHPPPCIQRPEDEWPGPAGGDARGCGRPFSPCLSPAVQPHCLPGTDTEVPGLGVGTVPNVGAWSCFLPFPTKSSSKE